jgi:hypothetical protein
VTDVNPRQGALLRFTRNKTAARQDSAKSGTKLTMKIRAKRISLPALPFAVPIVPEIVTQKQGGSASARR